MKRYLSFVLCAWLVCGAAYAQILYPIVNFGKPRSASCSGSAITLDAQSSEGSVNTGTSVSTTWTIGGSAKAALVVVVNSSGHTPSSVTLGGQSMTLQSSASVGSFIYGLLNPPTGSKTATANFVTSQASIWGISFNNAQGFLNPVNVNRTSGTNSITVTAPSGGASVAAFTTPGTTSLNQTAGFSDNALGTGGAYNIGSTSPTFTDSANSADADYIAGVAACG